MEISSNRSNLILNFNFRVFTNRFDLSNLEILHKDIKDDQLRLTLQLEGLNLRKFGKNIRCDIILEIRYPVEDLMYNFQNKSHCEITLSNIYGVNLVETETIFNLNIKKEVGNFLQCMFLSFDNNTLSQYETLFEIAIWLG